MIAGLLERHHRNLLGKVRGKAEFANVLREIFGEGTGDTAAKALAETWTRTAEWLRSRFNAAGGAMSLRVPKSDIATQVTEHWDRMIGVNIYGTFNTCHTIAPHMKKNGRGGIVSLASGAGMQGGPPIARQSGAACYSATKAGVIAFTQALSQELGPHGIRVNAVSPGRNESRAKPLARMLEMQKQEEGADPGSGRVSPLIRFGRPSDIGDAVAFLLSEEASYITGCCLDLTGGIRMH